MKKKIVLALLTVIILTAILLITACREKDEPSPELTPSVQQPQIEIIEFTFTRENFPRMEGSSSTAPLAQAAAVVLLGEQREDVEKLAEDFGRTSQSFRNLKNGLCDILIASEPASEVLDELNAMNFEVEMAQIALDALVFVVNAGNPVDNLTHRQIQDIYTGRITNWSEVGGDDTEIKPFHRNAEAGSRVLMEKLVMDGQNITEASAQNLPAASGMGETITAMKGLDGSTSAIGYTTLFFAEDMGMAEGLKILSVDGVLPNGETIRNKEYPFLNPYYAVISASKPENNPARIMWEWLQSNDGQRLVSLEGYVSVTEPAPESLPEMQWDVQTNFNILTPFTPQHSLHTRLHEGALSELIPSDNYGMLLPYSSVAELDDGYLQASKFGFVTLDGIVVTDLIYEEIERAEYIHGWYTGAAEEGFPAYSLAKDVQDIESDGNNHTIKKMAACAMDGSWVTEFDYINIEFTKEVIILYRDDVTFDIDVIDYDGNHLYNMLDFDWINNALNALDDTWTGFTLTIISDRHAHIRIGNRTFAFIDLLTGDIRTTRFIAADPFVEDRAPVGIGIRNTYFVQWGLINADFEVVIQPRYYDLPFFLYGKAIVQLRNNSQIVINMNGENLFNVPDGHWLEHSHEGPTFIMRSVFDTENHPVYLSSEFTKITPPEGMSEESFSLRYLNNGWYTTSSEAGSYLMREEESHYFPDFEEISFTDGELIIYTMGPDEMQGFQHKSGVMTLDGRDIIPPEPSVEIIPVTQNDTITAFIVETGASWLFTEEVNNQNRYRLVDKDENTIIQGRGILTYHETLEMYSIQSANHFSWLDKDANPIITIPLLSSTFD